MSSWMPETATGRGAMTGMVLPRAEVPDFSVKVNGAPMPLQARADVRAVTVEEDLAALSMFTLELYNWDDDKLQVSWSDSSLFALGSQVEIWLGYVDDLQRVMTAEITGLEPVFTADQPPTLTVRGYDLSHRFTRGRKTRSFAKIKDSAIVAQIAREAGLRAQVSDTKEQLDFVAQGNQTDWEFLRDRAGLLGYEVYVRDKTLYFRPPGHTAQPGRPAVARRRCHRVLPPPQRARPGRAGGRAQLGCQAEAGGHRLRGHRPGAGHGGYVGSQGREPRLGQRIGQHRRPASEQAPGRSNRGRAVQ